MHTTNTDYIVINGNLYRDTRSTVDGHDGPTQIVERDLVLPKDSLLSLGIDFPRDGRLSLTTSE